MTLIGQVLAPPTTEGAVSLRTGHLAISLGLGNALIDGLHSGECQPRQTHFESGAFVARLHGSQSLPPSPTGGAL